MSPALVFDRVDVTAGGRALLRGFDLEIPPRGLFGIVGPNGAGKSTLIKVAIGLVENKGGAIHVLGRPLATWRPRELARRIGYVPQHFHSHWDLLVRELLAIGFAPPGRALLVECELDGLLHRRFNTLSGGEQARATLARALAHEPALLLADEPTAHLDVPHQHHLMRLLAARARDIAIVIVLHDLHLAATYCDRIAVMSGGALGACGTARDVLSDAILAATYGDGLRRVEAEGRSFFTAERAAAQAT